MIKLAAKTNRTVNKKAIIPMVNSFFILTNPVVAISK